MAALRLGIHVTDGPGIRFLAEPQSAITRCLSGSVIPPCLKVMPGDSLQTGASPSGIFIPKLHDPVVGELLARWCILAKASPITWDT